MTIRYGRADIAELSRRLRRQLAGKPKGPPPPESERLDAFVYPTGWNAFGEPVRWELTSIAEHHAAGDVTVKGATIEQCKRRALGAILDGLVRTYKLSGEDARAKARDAVVCVTELPRRPEV